MDSGIYSPSPDANPANQYPTPGVRGPPPGLHPTTGGTTAGTSATPALGGEALVEPLLGQFSTSRPHHDSGLEAVNEEPRLADSYIIRASEEGPGEHQDAFEAAPP